jgi:hypothetical protein
MEIWMEMGRMKARRRRVWGVSQKGREEKKEEWKGGGRKEGLIVI